MSSQKIENEIHSLYQTYANDIYRYARLTLRDDALAMDVVQEVFLRAFRSWGTFRGDVHAKRGIKRERQDDGSASHRKDTRDFRQLKSGGDAVMTHDKEVTHRFKELTDISMTQSDQDELWQSISQKMKTMRPPRTRHKKHFNAFATSVAAVATIAVVAVGIGVGIDKHVFSQTPTTQTTGASNLVGTTSNPAANSQATSNRTNNQTPGSSQWKDVGRMYEVQGVVSFVKGHSFELKVSKNIQGANSAVTSPNYPFKVGSVVNIQCDPSLSPKVGDHVVLDVSQYATGGSPFWGVIANNYYAEQNGSYYNQSGQKLSLPPS
ncbi:RNA polymerase sigma factor [Alicyclobacillus sp. SO9]|uniref:RNA polymerase sigma factor n=1 Tax=Alicyclobacillus sp. SO9 TaxID=2665646 RepID=UPI001E505775|nr:sigma factor [Alicyclobacillus sp. SO9]